MVTINRKENRKAFQKGFELSFTRVLWDISENKSTLHIYSRDTLAMMSISFIYCYEDDRINIEATMRNGVEVIFKKLYTGSYEGFKSGEIQFRNLTDILRQELTNHMKLWV